MTGSRVRSVAAAVTGVLACLLLPLAMVGVWSSAMVTNTDRYVDTVGPLASDPVVQAAAERRITDAVLAQLDFEALGERIESELVEAGAGPIVVRLVQAMLAGVEQRAPELVQDVVHRVVTDETFIDAWEAANRTAHAEMVRVLSDEELVESGAGVSIQLATIVNAAVAELESRGFERASQVPEVEASFTLLEAEDLEPAQRVYRFVDKLGVVLPIAWVVLVALTLLLARGRRRATLMVAIGTLASVLVVAIGIRFAREAVASTPGIDGDVARHIWTAVLSRLRTSAQIAVVVCVVAALVAYLMGPGRAAVTTRDWARRTPALVNGWRETSVGAVAVPAAAVVLVIALLVWVI